VRTVGVIDPDEVSRMCEGVYEKEWKAQLNRRILEGEHDLILSIGQVVPHEVTGMANHAKNLFVGCGGAEGINESHYLGAVYGMERIMGRADTPPRRLLNAALERFCREVPLVFVLTVVGRAKPGEPADEYGLVTRGLFAGTGTDCFYQAAALALQVNFTMLKEPIRKAVVRLDPGEYQSAWLGNKAIYRTRMAMADDGELIILAPGLKRFGEDPAIDRLIRAYGYRPTSVILPLAEERDDLRANLSAAAHLIHGSSEGRFRITYCPGGLTKEEIEGVGYDYADLAETLQTYDPARLSDGWNEVSGEAVYYVSNPAVGLWAYEGRFA
jgi:nickel-dependent lactate racemase